MIELRGHHLLCTSLFQGSGYSEEFVKRMTEVVEKCIPDEEIRLITGMDHVCEKCPNKQEDNTCRLGNRDVLMKDEKTLEYALALPRTDLPAEGASGGNPADWERTV